MRTSSRLAAPWLVALLAGALAAGCGTNRSTETSSTTEQTDHTSQTGALTDADIAAIVTTANDIDVENGQMAQDKTESDQVRTFARQMVTDHQAANDKTKDLAGRINLEPANDNPMVQQMRDMASRTRDSLKALDKAQFDEAYVAAEVMFHQHVLQMIDSQLLPGAQNPELKDLIQQLRPSIAGHLEHAQSLQSQLATGGGARTGTGTSRAGTSR